MLRRLRVNIHVIAMKQLLGKIRSVITGLKIKWEFFISESHLLFNKQRRGGTLMSEDSGQMAGTTAENFQFKTLAQQCEPGSQGYTKTV